MLTTKLPPAAAILDGCIADIDNDRWVCGNLICNMKPKKPNENKPEAEGCALGLIGINGGDTFYLQENERWDLRYPTFDGVQVDEESYGKWNEESLTAMRILASVCPLEPVPYNDDPIADGRREAIIVSYNDDGFSNGCECDDDYDCGCSEEKLDSEKAREWFAAARAKAVALGL